jgi:hypothetical protein
MSLYVSPQVIPLTPGASANFTLVSTVGGLSSITFTPGVTGQATFAFISGDDNVQIYSATAAADAYATFPVLVTDANSTDATQFQVSVAPLTLNDANISTDYTAGGGYTSLGLINQVRLRVNEPNLPGNADLLSLANAAQQNIESKVGILTLVGVFPTIANQTVQALTNDISEIVSCSWSTGPVAAQGSLVYPMFQYDQGGFMDAAAGFPAVGFGPPTYYWYYRDSNGTLEMQMYPAAMVGQLNVYYRGRPNFWTLTSEGANGNASNLDPDAQECVVLRTMMFVLANRGRSGEAAQIWGPDYKEELADLKSKARRRTMVKGGQVRDVIGRTYPSPWGGL